VISSFPCLSVFLDILYPQNEVLVNVFSVYTSAKLLPLKQKKVQSDVRISVTSEILNSSEVKDLELYTMITQTKSKTSIGLIIIKSYAATTM